MRALGTGAQSARPQRGCKDSGCCSRLWCEPRGHIHGEAGRNGGRGAGWLAQLGREGGGATQALGRALGPRPAFPPGVAWASVLRLPQAGTGPDRRHSPAETTLATGRARTWVCWAPRWGSCCASGPAPAPWDPGPRAEASPRSPPEATRRSGWVAMPGSQSSGGSESPQLSQPQGSRGQAGWCFVLPRAAARAAGPRLSSRGEAPAPPAPVPSRRPWQGLIRSFPGRMASSCPPPQPGNIPLSSAGPGTSET